MKRIVTILILAWAALAVHAQNDGFDPELPPEPNVRYKVTVGVSHSDAGWVYGGGAYLAGQQITIGRYDAYVDPNAFVFYRFKCWTQNGREYTPAGGASSFSYTVGTEKAVFEAVYELVFVDPTLPPEPDAKYGVSVRISNSEAGVVQGGGTFAPGQQITIRRSDAYVDANASVFYKFKCWMLNGEEYTPAGGASSFSYTVGTDNVLFEAVYVEEDPDNVTSKVFLTAEPADACTFSMESGQRHLEDNNVYLAVYPTSDVFRFLGWYKDGVQVTTQTDFWYYIGRDDTSLTARFLYDPAVPGEPNGSQDEVAHVELGDVDQNGVVNVTDATELLNFILSGRQGELNAAICDVNQDGRIDVSDATEICNSVLKKK